MYWDYEEDEDRKPAFKATATRTDVLASDFKSEFYSNTLSGEQFARRDAYDFLNKQILELTGKKLPNPYGSPEKPTSIRQGGVQTNFAKAEQDWVEERKKLKKTHPQYADVLSRSVDHKAAAIAKVAKRESERNWENAPRGTLTGLARAAGTMGGFTLDPINLTATVGTGGIGSVVGVGAKLVLKNALKVGLVNAGVELASMPPVGDWRARQGDPITAQEGTLRTLMAFGTGFGIEGFIRGGYRGVQKALGREAILAPNGVVRGYRPRTDIQERPYDPTGTFEDKVDWVAEGMSQNRPTIKKALSEDATADDMEAAAKELGLDKDEDINLLLQEAREAEEEVARISDELPGVPEREIATRLEQAKKHALDPERHPPAGAVEDVPKAKKGEPNLKDNLGGVDAKAGDTFKVQGKKVHVEEQNLSEVGFDPEQLQSKSGGDSRGVTGRLQKVAEWNPKAAGRVVLFERADGTRLVADGHQKTGLAHKLVSEGGEVPPTTAFVLKESDGWTPAEVKAVAAKKNLQQGTVNPVDAARITRSNPELIDDSIPMSSGRMRRARSLSRLADDAFDAVEAGAIPERFAAIVADTLPHNKGAHKGIIDALIEAKPGNMDEASHVVAQLADMPDHVDAQMTLRGADTVSRDLLEERAAVAAALQRKLFKDKRVRDIFAAEADRIAGNQLSRDTNKSAAVRAAQANELFRVVTGTRGAGSDMLTEAAGRIQRGEKMADVVNDLSRSFKRVLDEEGINGLLKKSDPLEAHPKVDGPDDPRLQKMVDDATDDLFPEGVPQPKEEFKTKVKPKGEKAAPEPKKTQAEALKEKKVAERKLQREVTKKLKEDKLDTTDLDEAELIENHKDIIEDCKLS